jgi:hypothetical protein
MNQAFFDGDWHYCLTPDIPAVVGPPAVPAVPATWKRILIPAAARQPVVLMAASILMRGEGQMDKAREIAAQSVDDRNQSIEEYALTGRAHHISPTTR